jgi:hypothetical protein
MEDLPDDVIISNIEVFRNIIKQQKSYVDEMQLHLSNKDNVIYGLQQTIKLLESTIECNQELIEKLRTEMLTANNAPIDKEQIVSDITNDLYILKQLEEKEQVISDMLLTYIPKEQYVKELGEKDEVINNISTMKEQYVKELGEKDEVISNISTMKEQYIRELGEKDEVISNIKKEKLIINNGEHNIVNSIKDNIKKKYIKKELEIYKNENISLKNQIEFLKNMLMMNNMYNLHYPSYNHQPSHSSYNHQPSHSSYNHQPSHSSYNHQPSHSSYNNQQPHDLQQPSHEFSQLSYELNQPHRSNVKTAEQSKNNNNENQHKNKMGNVLEQLQQLQKQKQKDV